jgi:hypothetical protein
MTRGSGSSGCGWQPDGTGVRPGGDVGGDRQATESYSIRYTTPDRPGALVTVYFYGERTGRGEYGVTMQTEWLVCADPTDPGGTEQWSEADYHDLSPEVITSRVEAERIAREHAESHTADEVTWDGRTPWEPRP